VAERVFRKFRHLEGGVDDVIWEICTMVGRLDGKKKKRISSFFLESISIQGNFNHNS